MDEAVADAVRALADQGGLVHMRWSEGELGRPGDNLYAVTFVAARLHKLLIEFSEQVLAVLTEPQLVTASPIEVVIGYRQLTIDWQGFGDMTPHAHTTAAGRFTIDRPGA